jgi:diguanylate cyclase (GGDEF)-like protein
MSTNEQNWNGIGAGAASALATVRHPRPIIERPMIEKRGESDASRWLLTREALVNIVLIAVMISVVWGSIGLHLMQQREEFGWRAETNSGNLAQAAAESIGQTIASVDDALRFMRAIYMADPAHFDISAWTGRVNETRGVALEFALIGRDGKLMASSLGPVVTPGDFSHDDFFQAQTGAERDRLFISRPVAGHANGRWSVLFTRPIVAADGWFTGVIAASVDPSWLTRLHRSLDIGRGTVMLVGADGRIRALAQGGEPATTSGIGTTIDVAGLLNTDEHPDHGTATWVNPVDGTSQIVAFQRLADDDAYVIAGLNWNDVLAPYRLYVRQTLIFGSGITLLILIAGALLLNNTRRLLTSRQVLRDAVDAIGQGIVMTDGRGRVPVINRRARELLGIRGSLPDSVLLQADGFDGNLPIHQIRRGGAILEIHTHALGSGGFVRTYTDITGRKRAEAQIIHLAQHDSLTGLPNRRLLADRLSEAIAHQGPGGAVLLVDLDRFKNVNDRHGHAFGDRVLVQAANRMRGIVPEADLVARIGGDEFCVLQAAQAEPETAEALARELVRLLSEPYGIEGEEVVLGASVGIARYPADGTSVDRILTRADTALYRAKESGRNTWRTFEAAMDVRIAERRLLEQDLRDALALGQFSVYYQPIFDSTNCRVIGFEALCRWFHPTRGAISPDEFIPIAETTGVVSRLGEWVLETACAEAARWKQKLTIAVNLSPRQFRGTDLPDRVAAILGRTGLPPDRLTLEVTEGVLIENTERTLVAMSRMKKQGIRIALDDFGTGYSSLSYLRRFSFDAIKIDRSFVRTLRDDEDAQAVLRAILTLAQCLRLKVVAEGVETLAQLQWLRAEGCDAIQGYLLGRPMAGQQTARFLAEVSGRAIGQPVAKAAS